VKVVDGEAFRASSDVEVVGDYLHLRVDGLSAPRRARPSPPFATS
jgi:hypothetical protein